MSLVTSYNSVSHARRVEKVKEDVVRPVLIQGSGWQESAWQIKKVDKPVVYVRRHHKEGHYPVGTTGYDYLDGRLVMVFPAVRHDGEVFDIDVPDTWYKPLAN